MKQNLFESLPYDTIIDILSRLPVRTITICKSVSKPWLNLLSSYEFGRVHLSRSSPALVNCHHKKLLLIEFQGDKPVERRYHCNLVTKFDFSGFSTTLGIVGSVNGVLCFGLNYTYNLCLCNPITREYIDLPTYSIKDKTFALFSYGFGVSEKSGEYKVVAIFYEHISGKIGMSQIYSVGGKSWKIIEVPPNPRFMYTFSCSGLFLKGSLHWLVSDNIELGKLWVLCLDLETEVFTEFAFDHLVNDIERWSYELVLLEGCLCICSGRWDIMDLWMMKEYGKEKSWTKTHVIIKGPADAGNYCASIYPIKIFRDGDILIAWDEFFHIYYDNKVGTSLRDYIPDEFFDEDAVTIQLSIYTPSFVSLKFSFPMEKVVSLN